MEVMDPPALPEIGDEKEPLTPAVLPAPDEFEDDEVIEEQQIDDGVRRRHRKKGKQQPQHPNGGPRGTAKSPARLVSGEEAIQRSESLDLWMTCFDWNRAGMYCTLRRVAPNYRDGVPVGGELCTKKNSGFAYDEIVQRWGGGEFRLSVFGPRSDTDSATVPLNNKTFMIPGEALLDSDALPEQARDKMQQQGGPYARGPRPPDPATRAMDHMEREVERMRNAPDQSDKIADVYTHTLGVVQQAASDRASAAVSSAEAQAKMSFAMMEREREDRARLEDRVREMEKATMVKEENLRKQLATEIQNAQSGSMALITSLLPQMSTANSDHTKMIVAQYAAKEERMQAQHQADLNNMNQLHQGQLQMLNNSHEQQLRHLEVLHKSNCTILEAQIIALRAEVEALKRSVDDARRDADKARNDLMTRVTNQKETDPIDQMAKMSEIITMARGFGGAEKEEGIGSGLEDNPMMANVFKILDKGIPVAQEYFAQRRQQQGPPPGYPPQLPQGYAPPMPQPAMPPPPQQMVPAQRPRPPRPLPPPEPKLSREEVQEAIAFINGLISQPEPAPPEETAAGAIAILPNDTLKQLCRRTPEKLLVALEAEGMLTGPSATEKGKEYLTKMLHALKKKFKERGDMPPPVQGG